MKKLRHILEDGKRMVFFGGAGVSTESGIPDFRSENGLFQAQQQYGYPPEVLVSHSFFVSHPQEFFAYFRQSLLYPEARPNPAHRALAELERRGSLRAVITQNVDGLHQMAGSKTVYELHGSVRRNYCMDCREQYPLSHVLHPEELDGIPRCTCGGVIRPDIVLYEEMLDDRVVEKAVREIEEADVMIVGGTSLAVVPASSLVNYFRGHTLVLINRTPTSYDHHASLIFREPIGEVLAQAVGPEENQPS